MNGRPQVVFIHGAGGGGWEWRIWQEVFESYAWNTVAPDLQPSSRGLASTELEDYVDQVNDWLMAYDAAVLVGASMGGLLALKVAEIVSPAALVLINPIPPAGIPGWPARAVRFPDVIRWAGSTIEDTRESLSDADEDTVQWVHNQWRNESGAVMQRLYAGVPADPNPMPLLVLSGALDGDVPPETAAAVAETFEADFFRLAGVTHLGALLGWRAELAAELATAWLEQVLME